MGTGPFALDWRHPLPPYQCEGIERLLAGSLLLADEMGLGKTVQAIAALRVLSGRGLPGGALIAVPAGLVLQWRAQLRDWAPELRLATVRGTPEERVAAWRAAADVHLVGYESLLADMRLRAPFGPRRRHWGVVVADEAQRLRPLLLTGGQDAAQRARAVASFAADERRRAMVLSVKAGGLGLNLTAASVVLHADLWWTAAVAAQAEDRAHRIGQTRPVQVFAYTCADTIESRIAEIVARKQALFDMYVEGIDIVALGALGLDDLLEAVGF